MDRIDEYVRIEIIKCEITETEWGVPIFDSTGEAKVMLLKFFLVQLSGNHQQDNKVGSIRFNGEGKNDADQILFCIVVAPDDPDLMLQKSMREMNIK